MTALGKRCLHVHNSSLCCKAGVCAWLAKVKVYLLLQTDFVLTLSLNYEELIAKQGGPGIYTCNFGTWRHEISSVTVCELMEQFIVLAASLNLEISSQRSPCRLQTLSLHKE